VSHDPGWRLMLHLQQNQFIWLTFCIFATTKCNFHWNHSLKASDYYPNLQTEVFWQQHHLPNSCYSKIHFVHTTHHPPLVAILTVPKALRCNHGIAETHMKWFHKGTIHTIWRLRWELQSQTTFVPHCNLIQPWMETVAWIK